LNGLAAFRKIDPDEKEQRDNVEYPLGTTTALFEGALGM
jgi:hypothetical protein